MLDRHLRYLASVFLKAENIKPSDEDIALFMTLVDGVELFPKPILEQSPGGELHRIAFTSPEGGWQILLLSARFDVARVSPNPVGGSDLGNFEQFCDTAADILLLLMERFALRPHRLAVVREGMTSEMTTEESTEIAAKLFRMPTVYQNRSMTEWDWRCISEIERTFGERSEPLNVITTIKKQPGVVFQTGPGGASTILPTKRIRFDTDINTLPRNLEERFDASLIRDFLRQGPIWHSELEQSIDKLVS